MLVLLIFASCQETTGGTRLPDPEVKEQMREQAAAFNRMSVLHFESDYRKIGLENLKRAFMRNPYDVESFLHVTALLEKEQDWETLVDFYNYAVEIHGNHPILYSKMGEYYMRLDENHKAVNAFKFAIALNSTDPTNYLLLAQAYERLNQLSDALSTYNLLSIMLRKMPLEPEETKALLDAVEKNKERLQKSMQIPVTSSR